MVRDSDSPYPPHNNRDILQCNITIFYEFHIMLLSARSVSPSLGELKSFSRDLDRKMSGKHRGRGGDTEVGDGRNHLPLDRFQVIPNKLSRFPLFHLNFYNANIKYKSINYNFEEH